MQMHYTFPDRLLSEEPLHIHVVQNQLTRNIPKLVPTVAGEIEWGFERGWGTDQEWKEVKVWDSALRIVAGAGNGAFCGRPLCTYFSLYTLIPCMNVRKTSIICQ